MPDAAALALPRRLARRRALCLIAVHLLIGLHVAHWKVAGRTLAPLELNEVMHTLELGIVTAGFLLMASAVLATALCGRFFCSWGCHLLALQDLSAWLLAKARIRPQPVRSRLLRWLPAVAAFYMFVWPQLARLLVRRLPAAGALLGPRPEFRLRIAGEEEGWASFLTTDFARNLPGPGIAALTLAVCGGVLVYFLGTRSFCRDVCPYGAVFSLADRFAPGRVRLSGDCTGCARCTAVCDSGVRVHEEVALFGRVTSGECLKDLDCIGVCPTGGLTYGRAAPPLLGRRAAPRRYDSTAGEEIAAALAAASAFVALRGLYRLVPFLLALALATLAGWVAVVGFRLARRREVRWQRWSLARAGRLTASGRWFAAGAALVAAASVHAGVVRAHEVLGDRAWSQWAALRARGGPTEPTLDRLLRHLEARARFGLVRPPDLMPRLAAVRLGRAETLAERGRLAAAEAEVAGADVGAAHHQLPRLAGGDVVAALVDHPRRHARQRRADAPGPARAGVRVAQQHAGLGHAVALEDRVAGELAEGGEGLGGERRAAAAA